MLNSKITNNIADTTDVVKILSYIRGKLKNCDPTKY